VHLLSNYYFVKGSFTAKNIVNFVRQIMNFQEIPVRVSINEYLEIAKQYSTPQSHQFINALIDGVVQKLENEGKIKKSGRGLLKA
jgi:N utilization substance protein B